MNLPEFSYLSASILFILGLKKLSSPKTARFGNIIAGIGMALAVLGTLLLPGMAHFGLIAIAIVVGTIPGWILAKKVKMTDMPQMVSLFNGMGGACALCISIAEYLNKSTDVSASHTVPILFGTVFGAISFTGSLVAFGKLQGLISEKQIRLPLHKFISFALTFACAYLSYKVFIQNEIPSDFISNPFYLIVIISLIMGVLQVMPIGGADMPVVISVLNSCTGMAAAVTGFAMQNMSMIIAGTLVGAAGSLLTILMCQAMNRSLLSVLFGSFGEGSASATGAAQVTGTTREISSSEAAILLSYAKKVIVVPGYGLAVAQAQHLMHELDEILDKKGVELKYAIHPVAGRMPGHMNVLLAESNVAYMKLLDMEEVNPDFPQTDVVLVVGANDVVNPAARNDKSSPIYGMPILDVDHAKNIIVIKRGKGVGFAGIENSLFFDPKTRMLYGDAKSVLKDLITEVKAL